MIEDIQSKPYIPANRHSAIKRIADYLSMMDYAGKPVTHVVLFADDYDAIFKAAQKHNKTHSLPAVTGLRYGSIPVNRGGKK